jgi:hypothetical protein
MGDRNSLSAGPRVPVMTRTIDLRIDVTAAAALDEPATVALTIHLPKTVAARPVVCFAKPGGGYSRGYFTHPLPGPGTGAQADWHAERGWIFVSVDHLGVGESSSHHDPGRLDYTTVAAASHAAEQEVLARLARGTLAEDFAALTEPVAIGIGQSLGGCMTIIQQGRYHCYDGIGVLGYSAIWSHAPMAPGHAPMTVPWVPRDTHPGNGVITNVGSLTRTELLATATDSAPSMGWAFYYDDVDPGVVARDLEGFPTRGGALPPWASATFPGTAMAWCLAPGAVMPEAAAVRSPVLVAMGERDVVADPRGEARAYLSTESVDLFVCPRMGHMHNFAGTRELLWARIGSWAEWVCELKTHARTFD